MTVKCSVNGRHIVAGEPELHLALGAATIAQARQLGFTKFSAVEELAIELETDVKKKMRACRGVKQTVKTSNRKFDLKYKTTVGGLGISEAQLLFHSTASGGNTARLAIANVAGTTFNFDTGAAGTAYVRGRWMEILDANGNRVRDLDAATFTGGNLVYGAGQDQAALVEGVDFEVDLKLGLVAFKAAIDDDVITPTITCAAITSASDVGFAQKIVPGTKFTHRGIGHLFVFDDDEKDNLAMRHEDFLFEMIATSGPTFGDDEFANFELELTILNPSTSAIYARPDVDLWGNVLT